MYEVNDWVADEVVGFATEAADLIDRQIRSLRGPEYADLRARYRGRADGLRRVAAGLNTGEGVTRASAKVPSR